MKEDADYSGIELRAAARLSPDLTREQLKRLTLAEMYGMGDVRVGLQITGQYPNPTATGRWPRPPREPQPWPVPRSSDR